MSCILITGSNGFIGRSLCRELLNREFLVSASVRRMDDAVYLPPGCDVKLIDGIDGETDWLPVFNKKVDVLVHLAARVHIMQDQEANPLVEFRKINRDGTLNLGRQAASVGVNRFVYISSIKVNGEETPLDHPFTAEDPTAPTDPYGISKSEAEVGLRRLAAETGMEVVIIRPPLVYGPGVKANFFAMMRWLKKGIPLPLGAVRNKRTFVALDNLIDLIITCISHPAAGNQTFLAGDGEDLSTPELLHRMGLALGRPARLFSIPPEILKFGASLIGKRAVVQRLCDSLQVDTTNARILLNWIPPISVDDALQKTARHFMETSSQCVSGGNCQYWR